MSQKKPEAERINLVVATALLVACASASADDNSINRNAIFSILKNEVGNSIENSKVDVSETAEVLAGSDASSAMFTISRTRSKPATSTFDSWNLSLSAPLNESEDKTDFGGFDKLANSTALSFSFSRWKAPGLNIGFVPKDALYDRICAEVNAGYQASDNYDAETPELETCISLDLIKEYVPDKYSEYEVYWWKQNGFITSYGIEGKVGDQNFDYYSPDNLEKSSKSDTSWSVKLFYSFLPVGWETKTLFTVNAEYQGSKKDADSGTLCPLADPMTQISTCVSGAIGAPVDDDAKSISLAVRRSYAKTAMTLEVIRDFEEDVTIVDWPIYFIRNKDMGLSGGFRMTWRDDTKDTTFGFFVGSTFSIL